MRRPIDGYFESWLLGITFYNSCKRSDSVKKTPRKLSGNRSFAKAKLAGPALVVVGCLVEVLAFATLLGVVAGSHLVCFFFQLDTGHNRPKTDNRKEIHSEDLISAGQN